MRAWRICLRKFAAEAWSGEGAWRYGGRWNSPGVRVIYASGSLALAALEYFVHLEPNLAPGDLLALSADIEGKASIETLSADQLPPDWTRPRAQPALRRLGDTWAGSARTLALQVPSAVVPGEWNWLINPRHAEFDSHFAPAPPVPFRFDARMFGR